MVSVNAHVHSRIVYAGQLAAYAGKRSISVFQLLVSIPATPSVRVAAGAGAVATYAATTYAVSWQTKLSMTRMFHDEDFDSIRVISKTPNDDIGKIKMLSIACVIQYTENVRKL